MKTFVKMTGKMAGATLALVMFTATTYCTWDTGNCANVLTQSGNNWVMTTNCEGEVTTVQGTGTFQPPSSAECFEG